MAKQVTTVRCTPCVTNERNTANGISTVRCMCGRNWAVRRKSSTLVCPPTVSLIQRTEESPGLSIDTGRAFSLFGETGMTNGAPAPKKKSSIGVKASAAEAGKYTREAGVLAYYEVRRLLLHAFPYRQISSRSANSSKTTKTIASTGIDRWVFLTCRVKPYGSVSITFAVSPSK